VAANRNLTSEVQGPDLDDVVTESSASTKQSLIDDCLARAWHQR
jgi:hypothetical protein